VLIAVWSAASGAAGLLWGTRGTRLPLLEAHVAIVVLLPVCVAPLVLASSPVTMGLLVILAGIPIAPLVASRNQLVERLAPAGTATEAFTWPLTALVAGVSVGAAVAGAVIESGSWSSGVLVAIGVSALGSAVVLTRRGTLVQPVATGG
jgi:hypothetical protein